MQTHSFILFLTMAFHLRNSMHFLSLIFLRLFLAETLNVTKASVIDGNRLLLPVRQKQRINLGLLNLGIEREG